MVRILTANLGGRSDVADLNVLVVAIRFHRPDVVVLQEVASVEGVNVLEELNKVVDYPFSLFSFQFDFSKDYGKGILQEKSVINGLGVLSKFEFSSEVVDLPIIVGQDRWPRIAIKYSFKDFSLCNVHFSKLAESRALEVPILPKADVYAGDFNMQPDELKMRFDLRNSFDFKKYLSFPSKRLTLDYVLLTKGKFVDLVVVENVSDHNGLFVKLNIH